MLQLFIDFNYSLIQLIENLQYLTILHSKRFLKQMRSSSKKNIVNKMKRPTYHASTINVQKQKERNLELIARSLDMRDKKQIPLSQSLDKIDIAPTQQYQQRFRQRQRQRQRQNRPFRFELKCADSSCDDDTSSVISYGGYSVKSKIGKKNQIVHNHRKLNHFSSYDYNDNEVPYIYQELYEKKQIIVSQKEDQQKETPPQLPKLPKVNWKISPFAPIFVTKNDPITTRQKQILHDQSRQRQQIAKYETQYKKQVQNQKHNKLKKVFKKNLKQNTKLQSRNEKFQGNHGRNTRLFDGNQKSQQQKIRTRYQQRQEQLSGFEISQMAQPFHNARYCYPCRQRFEDYKKHIEQSDHKRIIRVGAGIQYFIQQMDIIRNKKNEQIQSVQYKFLVDIAGYLQNIADSLQEMHSKNKRNLALRTHKIKKEIDMMFRR